MSAVQFDLFGQERPPADLSPSDQVAYILERFPECRGDDRELMLRFWETFDGLRSVLGDEAFERFAAWFRNPRGATHPETVRRRRAAHQQLAGDGGHLLPDRAAVAYRRAQSRAGEPRR